MKSPSRWLLALACVCLGVVLGAYFSGSVSQGQNPAAVPAIPREMTSYRSVVKRVLPAVVSINARARPRKPLVPRGKPPVDGVPKEFRPYFEEPERRSDAAPDDGDLGFGSGWVMDPNGVILSNYHVVEGADELEVQMPDGRRFVTTDFRADKKSDLAVIRVQAGRPLPYLEFGDSDAMEVGDRVLAVGAPFGLKGSVTSGIVSAKGRSLRLNTYEDFIQTDAAVNPGNSGGPLVNLEGKVVGITSAIKSKTGGFQGVGLAIASNLVKRVMGPLLKGEVVHHGYLGMQVDDLDADALAKLGLKSGAVRANKVLSGSPAAKAGIKVGDVITIIAGKPIRDGREMQRLIGDLPLNTSIDITVLRGGKLYLIPVTVVDQPDVIDVPRRSPGRDRQ